MNISLDKISFKENPAGKAEKLNKIYDALQLHVQIDPKNKIKYDVYM